MIVKFCRDIMLLTDIIVKVVSIVKRVDDNFPGGNDSFIVILNPSVMIPQRHVEIVNVDVL